jgi:hypothetical protein
MVITGESSACRVGAAQHIRPAAAQRAELRNFRLIGKPWERREGRWPEQVGDVGDGVGFMEAVVGAFVRKLVLNPGVSKPFARRPA